MSLSSPRHCSKTLSTIMLDHSRCTETMFGLRDLSLKIPCFIAQILIFEIEIQNYRYGIWCAGWLSNIFFYELISIVQFNVMFHHLYFAIIESTIIGLLSNLIVLSLLSMTRVNVILAGYLPRKRNMHMPVILSHKIWSLCHSLWRKIKIRIFVQYRSVSHRMIMKAPRVSIKIWYPDKNKYQSLNNCPPTEMLNQSDYINIAHLQSMVSFVD